MTIFFYPTTEVITFHLCGWCMLGVFLLLDINVRIFGVHGWNACVHRLDLHLYSHPKEFWGNGLRIHVNSKGKIPSTGKILLRGGSHLQCCITQDSQSNTLPTELLQPHPAARTGVCVAAKGNSSVLNSLSCFFAFTQSRVHDGNLFQVCSQAGVLFAT